MDAPTESRRQVLLSQPDSDPELVEEVLALITKMGNADNLLHNSSAQRLRHQLLSAAPLLSDGETIAQRFRIVRLIGAGGMGEVYEADDVGNPGSPVALKTLRPEWLDDPNALKRLRREAFLARQIAHPNVCRIYDVIPHTCEGVETSIIVMELLTGPTLSAHLKETGALPLSVAEPLIRQLAVALGSAHQVGVIHRDFKPSNIIISGTRAVVTDFGLARPSVAFATPGSAFTTLTLSGQLIGTPEYMAPEQIRHGISTEQSDIYSLGVVMFEMLTGQRPTGTATGMEGILNRLLEPPPSPRTVIPAIPSRWETLILKCLERDPARRFASIPELLATLDAWWHMPRLPAPSRRTIFVGSAITLSTSAAAWRYWNQPVTLPGSRILMTAIENKTGDPGFDQIGLLLQRQIAQSGRVQLVEPRRIAELLQRMNLPAAARPTSAQAREMAVRDDAAGVLSGSLSTLGSDFELRLRLEPARPGMLRSRQAATKDFTSTSKRDLFPLLDDAARWVRERAGETASEIARFDRPAEDTTTSSWEAWRLYTDSKARVAKDDLPGAIALLKEATRLDPGFVMAWRDRADYELRRHDYRTGYATWEQAIQVLDQRQNTSIEAYRTRAMYFEDTGRFAQAEQAYRALLALVPGDYLGRLYLSSVLEQLRRPAEALATIEPLLTQQKPLAVVRPVRIHLSQGRLDLARQAAVRVRQAGLAGWADYCDYTIAMCTADYPSALRFATSLSKSKESTWTIRGPLVVASFHGYRGELPEARAALHVALDQARAQGNTNWQERIPLWDLYLATKLPNADLPALRHQFALISKITSTPEFAVDVAFVGHILGLPVPHQLGNAWPAIPAFDLPRAQLRVLESQQPALLAELLAVASRAALHRHRDALEFAVALCQHRRWPATAIAPALAQGAPSHGWGNELALPARLTLQ